MTATGTIRPQEVLLDTDDVAMQPWRPLGGNTGLSVQVLWQEPETTSYAGLLHMNPDTSLPPHIHRAAVHHLWVVWGTCMINGRRLDGGSYVYVPAGVEHGIQRAGRGGCLLFYLDLIQPAT